MATIDLPPLRRFFLHCALLTISKMLQFLRFCLHPLSTPCFAQNSTFAFVHYAYEQINTSANGREKAPLALFFYIGSQPTRKGVDRMRKYTLANSVCRGAVDLRNYKDIIVSAVFEFAPKSTVTVEKGYYTVNEPLTQSQAVRIGRKICESDLSQHCIKLSKLFNSTLVKEKTDDKRNKQKQIGGHH